MSIKRWKLAETSCFFFNSRFKKCSVWQQSERFASARTVVLRRPTQNVVRTGATLIELIVCCAILAVLVAILIPAVLMAREAALFAQGQFQLRQIGLAIHNYSDSHGQQLPRNMHGWELPQLYLTDPPEMHKQQSILRATTALSSILPQLDECTVYQLVLVQGTVPVPGSAGGADKVFQNPLDPSGNGLPTEFSCSYVSNAQVFSMARSMNSGFRDGLSNTIFFAEHYRYCGVRFFDLFTTYAHPRLIPGATPNTNGWQATAPTFADFGYSKLLKRPKQNDFYPITTGDPARSNSATGVTFQTCPPINQCDPRLPNSASSRGLQVLMGDDSVRTLASGISPYVFLAAVTPDRGEVDLLAPDF
jgi:type II secretory pathway pseudopilin PulG